VIPIPASKSLIGLALLLLAQAGAGEIRAVQVSITDKQGRPVDGLIAEEVAILENGVARDLASIRRDDRPLTAAILVDTSQAVASQLRLNVIEAVGSLLRRLPEGSRYTLWTTGARPEKVVELTEDPVLGVKALRSTFPQGGNTILDGLIEAMRDLNQVEGERNTLIAISGQGVEFSYTDHRQIVDLVSEFDVMFMGVLFREGGGDSDTIRRLDYVFGELASKTGGLFESPLSVLGVTQATARVSGDLDGQYRLRYATLPNLEKRKLEVQVARPDIRVRVSMPEAEARKQ